MSRAGKLFDQLLLFDCPAPPRAARLGRISAAERRRAAALADVEKQEPIQRTFRTAWAAYLWLVKMNRRIK